MAQTELTLPFCAYVVEFQRSPQSLKRALLEGPSLDHVRRRIHGAGGTLVLASGAF